jgi:hypothetical protein
VTPTRRSLYELLFILTECHVADTHTSDDHDRNLIVVILTYRRPHRDRRREFSVTSSEEVE